MRAAISSCLPKDIKTKQVCVCCKISLVNFHTGTSYKNIPWDLTPRRVQPCRQASSVWPQWNPRWSWVSPWPFRTEVLLQIFRCRLISRQVSLILKTEDEVWFTSQPAQQGLQLWTWVPNVVFDFVLVFVWFFFNWTSVHNCCNI